MSRDGSGNYTLPLPDVLTGTTIEASWANSTLADIEAALTDSLSRSGSGSMSSSLKLVDGSVTVPSLNWSSEGNSGLYRAGANDIRMSVAGADMFRWTTANGVQYWDNGQWNDVATAADGSAVGDVLYWDTTSWVASSVLKIDNGNSRLGINEATPEAPLHITRATDGDVAILECPVSPTAFSGLKIGKELGYNRAYVRVGFKEDGGPCLSYGAEAQSGHTGSLVLRNEFDTLAAGVKIQTYNGSTYDDHFFVNGSGGTWIYNLSADGPVYAVSGGLLTQTPPAALSITPATSYSVTSPTVSLTASSGTATVTGATTNISASTTVDISGNTHVDLNANGVNELRAEVGQVQILNKLGINEAAPDTLLHATRGSAGDIAILETIATPTSHSGLRIAKGGTGFTNSYLKVGFDENAAPSISYGADSHSGTGALLLRNEFDAVAAGLKFQSYNGSTYDDHLFINGSGGTWIYQLGTGTVYSNAGFLQNSDPSDRRLKKHIDPIDAQFAWDAVIGIEPKSFEWKSKKRGEGTQLGFIAQDVQNYLPELVEENHDGKLGIKAQQLVPVLWAAVRELMLRVEELEAKLDS